MKPPVFDPAWPDEVVALYRHDMQEIWDQSIAPQIWNQYHNQLSLYLGIAGRDEFLDILDVGCAQGTLALLLAEAGHNVLAVDIRQPFLDYAASRYERGRIEFRCGNVLEIDPGRKFDLIYANQIIEHLVYPREMIARLKASLKPGGRLVCTTPNGDYAMNSLPSFAQIGDPTQWEEVQFSADADGHFFAYLDSELVDIFVTEGLTNVRIDYFETPWISGHMKIRYLHGLVPSSVLAWMDRVTLAVPVVGKRLSHQLIITGDHTGTA